MGKSPQQEKANEAQGTPSYVLVSIIFAILIFAIEGFKASIGLGDEPKGLINLAFVALGLSLAFFWRRLQQSRLRSFTSIVYTLSLWAYLWLVVAAPHLHGTELPSSLLVQQFGFAAVLVSGLALLAAVFYDAKQAPSLLLACMAGLLASLGSIWGLMPAKGSAARHGLTEKHHGEEPSAHGHGADEDEEEEEIHASQFAAHGSKKPKAAHDEHGDARVAAEEPEDEAEGVAEESHHAAEAPAPLKPLKRMAARAKPEEEESHGHEPSRGVVAKDKEKSKHKEKAAKHQAAPLAHSVHWEYEGDRGPEAWGELSPEFKLCEEGIEQSPIDIPKNWPLERKLELHYRPSGFEAVDNGHTIQFNVEAGNFLMIGPKRYELKQIHFHTPSEHFFNGRSSILEAHFVHATAKGELAVLGSMIEPGILNKEYQKIWAHIPKKAGESQKPRGKLFDPRALLPEDLSVYAYPGSLTTPPCSEKVSWNVLRESVQMSQDQINRFRARYRLNARPIQPLNER